MILNLNDQQKKLLLETVAIAHMIKYMKGEDNSDLDELIQEIAKSLKDEGKMEIFNSVFQEFPKM